MAFDGPESTEAEVEAAERIIRENTALSVQKAKRNATKSVTVFVACAVLTVPFMAGMPMHSFFRPWGQLLLICVALSFSWAGLACMGVLSAQSYHREAAKFLDSLHDDE